MHLHELLTHAQAEAGALETRRRTGAEKAGKHHGQFIFGNADAAIPDRNVRQPILSPAPDIDVGRIRRVLDSVRQQVAEEQVEQISVAGDLSCETVDLDIDLVGW